jgi:hypothetical protein
VKLSPRKRRALDTGFWACVIVSVLASLGIASAGPGVDMAGWWWAAVLFGFGALILWMMDPETTPGL